MLVLSRVEGQSLMIGESEIRVLHVDGKQVRFGIVADRSIPVHRKEVYDRIQEEEGENRPGTEILESRRKQKG